MGFLAVGEDGLILRLGGSAREHDEPFAPGVKREKYDGSKHLNGVARTKIPGVPFALAIAVGDDGVALIRKTTGEWKRELTGTGRDLNAVSIAPGTDTAWAVGDEGTILRTKDGGKHWSIQTSHTTRHLRAVVAVNETTAWATGDEGEILATSDAGAGWKRKDEAGERKHLRAISLGPTLVLAVGDDGTLVFRDNGKWGTMDFAAGKNFRATYIDQGSSLIFVIGDDGTIAIRSTSSSLSANPGGGWTLRTGVTTKHLRGIAREKKQWAIVGDSAFLTSDDVGASWQKHGAGSLRAVC